MNGGMGNNITLISSTPIGIGTIGFVLAGKWQMCDDDESKTNVKLKSASAWRKKKKKKCKKSFLRNRANRISYETIESKA